MLQVLLLYCFVMRSQRLGWGLPVLAVQAVGWHGTAGNTEPSKDPTRKPWGCHHSCLKCLALVMAKSGRCAPLLREICHPWRQGAALDPGWAVPCVSCQPLEDWIVLGLFTEIRSARGRLSGDDGRSPAAWWGRLHLLMHLPWCCSRTV